MALQEIESQIATLNRAEKARIMQILSRELFDSWPGVEKTPGVSGGEACILLTLQDLAHHWRAHGPTIISGSHSPAT